jgi:hypothetical protein
VEDNGIEKQDATGSRLANPWEADKAFEERLKFLWEVHK